MSIIRANQITDASGGSTAQINGVAPTVDNLRGKNKIINGNFDVWQRGTSGFTGTSDYTADRWQVLRSSGTSHSISQQVFTVGQSDVPNEPTYFFRSAVTTGAGSSDYSAVRQLIEGVRTLAGQTATISFYAKADSAKDIALEMSQSFGTGGSGAVNISPQTCSLTTSWQRFELQFSIPSITGKTIGTGSQSLEVLFWFSAGSGFNSRTNSLGNQSGTFDIAQVQLEAGSVATSFETRSYGEELALCQRYYYRNVYNSGDTVCPSANWTATTTIGNLFHPVVMRADPTGSVSNAAGDWVAYANGVSRASTTANTNAPHIYGSEFHIGVSGSTGGDGSFIRGNNPNVFIAFDAEL